MRHLSNFENFSLNESQSGHKAMKFLDLAKKDPAVKKYAEDCEKLVKSMSGAGTNEDKIMEVFKSLKSKEELGKLLAMWDSLDLNYEKSGENFFVSFAKIFSGTSGAYEKQVKNRYNIMSPWMKDIIDTAQFWKERGGTNVDAYFKARKEWYDKNPNQKETSLNYWLKEELNDEEMKNLNDIVKKWGVKF